MHFDTQSTCSSYIHNQRASVLSDMAANYTQHTGCAPVFVFSQEVSLDPQAALQTIGLRMYNKGMTTGTKVHTISLLELLSAGKTQQEMLYSVLQTARENDGVVFLEDVYRYDYDRVRAFAFLEKLVQAYQNPQARCPLVMKAPPPSDRQILRNCPALQKSCFHLSMEPISVEVTPRTKSPLYEQPRTASWKYQQAPSAAREPSNEAVRTSASKSSQRSVPWYQVKPQLLMDEYNGLIQFLSQRNLSFQVEEPNVFSYSGRVYITLRLHFQELGQCKLRIVYDNIFQKNCTSDVSVAISGYDIAQIQKRLRLVNNVYDQELGGHLFRPNCSPRILADYGVAAATVDGFIRALM